MSLHRARRSTLSSAAMIILATLLTSCGSPARASDPHAEPPLGEVKKVLEIKDLSLPLNAYLPTPQQDAVIAQARDILIRDCMDRFGFTWTVPEQRVGRHENDTRYGITSLSDAKTYGYHATPSQSQGERPKPGSVEPPSAAEQTVLTGEGKSVIGGNQVPRGGCYGEADKALGLVTQENAGQRDVISFVRELDGQASNAAQSDSRLLDAHEKWNQCMSSKGYDYKEPWAANDDPEWRTDKPSQTEIATAIADIDCRVKTNLVGISVAIDTAYQTHLIETNAEALQQVRSKLDGRIKNATDVVEGRG